MTQSQALGPVPRLFHGYPALADTYGERFADRVVACGPFARIAAHLAKLLPNALARSPALAETALLHQSVAFSVHGDPRGTGCRPFRRLSFATLAGSCVGPCPTARPR